jgi:phosphatidylserine/phosphatidylglycerophosphate/cardiolipin synthase-like enzyme
MRFYSRFATRELWSLLLIPFGLGAGAVRFYFVTIARLFVIDKRKAFCGSMNISSDYAGPKLGTNRFRDSLAEISGPAALDLLQITIESIQESLFKNQTNNLENPIIFVNNKLSINMIIKNLMRKKLSLFSQEQSDSTVQVLRSNTRRNLTHIQKAMEECLNRAVDYCYFTTPYFLPYDNLRKAIIMPPGVALTCEFSPLAYQTSRSCALPAAMFTKAFLKKACASMK